MTKKIRLFILMFASAFICGQSFAGHCSSRNPTGTCANTHQSCREGACQTRCEGTFSGYCPNKGESCLSGKAMLNGVQTTVWGCITKQ